MTVAGFLKPGPHTEDTGILDSKFQFDPITAMAVETAPIIDWEAKTISMFGLELPFSKWYDVL